jgi:Tfp pilus assembly protein PilF
MARVLTFRFIHPRTPPPADVPIVLVVLLVAFTGVPVAHGQAVGTADTLSAARQLSAAGDFPGAAALLQPFVTNNPEIADAWLFLALNQYWAGRGEAARSTFAEGMKRHPSDRPLIASYARFLMDQRQYSEARALLAEHPDPDAELLALIGTLAYWRGDLTAATRAFNRALVADPSHEEASRQLAELRSQLRPWVRVAAGIGSDSQPLERRMLTGGGGFFLTPLQAVEVEISHGEHAAGGGQYLMNSVHVTHRKTWAAARARSAVSVGGVDRLGRLEGTYSGRLGVRLVRGLEVEASAERAPYLYTEASLAEPIFPVAMSIGFSLDNSGWYGQAVIADERFVDENSKRIAYAWLLAPVVRMDHFTVGLGYVFSYQHAAESRFVPVMTAPPSAGRPPVWEGRYRPYYTPRDLQTHGITASATARPAPGITLTFNGAYAFSGVESAPYVYQLGGVGAPLIGFHDHSINPWNVRGAANLEIVPGTSLRLEAEHMKTTWYEMTSSTLSLVTRL